MSNFVIRFLSAFFLLPILLYILFLNNFFFYLLIIIVYLILIYEIKFLKKTSFSFIFLNIIFISSFYCLLNLRGETLYDYYLLVWVMSIAWLSDIGGYLIGKIFGGPKLSKISPNKTIAGFFGSIIFSQLSFAILILFEIEFSINIKIILMQIFLSLVTIIGDLVFSYIKRKYNIKDFSHIIPGHGGILDRIDGLIFVLIFAYLFKIVNVY